MALPWLGPAAWETRAWGRAASVRPSGSSGPDPPCEPGNNIYPVKTKNHCCGSVWFFANMDPTPIKNAASVGPKGPIDPRVLLSSISNTQNYNSLATATT